MIERGTIIRLSAIGKDAVIHTLGWRGLFDLRICAKNIVSYLTKNLRWREKQMWSAKLYP